MPNSTGTKDASQSVNKTDKRIEAALGAQSSCTPFLLPRSYIKLTLTLPSPDFVRGLYKILSSNPSDAPATDQLVDQINQHGKKLHTYTHKPVAGVPRDPEVDQQGTRLWNICTRLRRECDPTNKRLKRLYLYGRVLAFHLLVVANPRETRKAQDLIYVVKLALKAARDCVGMDNNPFSSHWASRSGVADTERFVQKARNLN